VVRRDDAENIQESEGRRKENSHKIITGLSPGGGGK
jgi:hypothetical protein